MNKQFPHPNCNSLIRMDSSTDNDKKYKAKGFVESEIEWNALRETASLVLSILLPVTVDKSYNRR